MVCQLAFSHNQPNGFTRQKLNEITAGVWNCNENLRISLMAASGKEIEKCKDPLIGLQYIKESFKDGISTFYCDLCHESAGSTFNEVIVHTVFRNHRSTYMKKYYEPYFNKIISSPIHEQNKLYCDYSRIIESNEGRKKIQLAPRPPPETIDPGAKYLLLDDPKLSNVSNIGPLLNRLMLQYGFKNLGEMFSSLGDELITNEDEATKAFEVANILTKTLLEYKLKTAP